MSDNKDQDQLADDWEKSLGGNDSQVDDTAWSANVGPADLASDRLLNQEEVDSLLGFKVDDLSLAGQSGIRAIVDSSAVSYERLPMLEIVFDRLVRLLTSSLRSFFSDNVEVSLDRITSVRFGDYVASIPLPAILSVFKAEEWENNGLVFVDSSLIYLVIDCLLGGKRGSTPIKFDGRPYTTIEISLVRRMLDIVLKDCSEAFSPLSPVSFTMDRIETNPRFASITRPANAAILIELRLDMEGRGGIIEILLPHATIEPIRELLLQSFMGEKLGRDPTWEGHLATEIYQASVDLDAVLAELTVPLRRIVNLKVGDTLFLETEPDPVVHLKTGSERVCSGRMGRIGDAMAVQLVRPLIRSRTTLSVFDMSATRQKEA
jgi:flagellar motor switch protein FliM